tara:strand:- start:810 stop:1016 length:207 start_codon:yes stop_codon:yes gene_type:complete
MRVAKRISASKMNFDEDTNFSLINSLFVLSTFIGVSLSASVIGYFFYVGSPFTQETFIKLTSLAFLMP